MPIISGMESREQTDNKHRESEASEPKPSRAFEKALQRRWASASEEWRRQNGIYAYQGRLYRRTHSALSK